MPELDCSGLGSGVLNTQHLAANAIRVGNPSPHDLNSFIFLAASSMAFVTFWYLGFVRKCGEQVEEDMQLWGLSRDVSCQ